MQPPEDNTQITEHLQPSVLVIVLRLLAALFMLDLIYSVLILGFLGLTNLHEWHTPYVILLLFVNVAKYLLITIVVVRLFADWAGRTYYLTGHHLIQKLGLINITETTFELSQLKSIVIKQGWLGRRFNFGTIKLTFAAYGDQQSVTLREINNPYRYKKHFDNYLEHYLKGEVR
jgi:membrane protein YdbS with pleckstrin-like domain